MLEVLCEHIKTLEMECKILLVSAQKKRNLFACQSLLHSFDGKWKLITAFSSKIIW